MDMHCIRDRMNALHPVYCIVIFVGDRDQVGRALGCALLGEEMQDADYPIFIHTHLAGIRAVS